MLGRVLPSDLWPRCVLCASVVNPTSSLKRGCSANFPDAIIGARVLKRMAQNRDGHPNVPSALNCRTDAAIL